MTRVSVVVPTYNRADVLSRAIDSVLAQTVTDVELIVVDDGSTDDTQDRLRSYDDPRLTVLRHPENRGGSAARNTGIEAATGEYVAFLDSDDTWRPRKLEVQLEALESRSAEWIAAYCDAAFVAPNRRSELVVALKRRYARLRSPNVPTEGGEELIKYVLTDELHTSGGSTLIAERDAVEAIGGFDESFDRFQDPEFIIRLLEQGNLAHVPETLVDRYESANPPAEVVRAADEHYLERFSGTVDSLEAEGHPIRSIHEFMLARLFFSEGRFRDGLRHLEAARGPGLAELPSLLLSVAVGVRERVSGSAYR